MKRFAGAAILFAATILCAPSAAAQSEADSRAAIERALQSVELAAQSSGAERDANVRAALRALEADERLAASAPLREPLVASPPQIERAQARLVAARAALERPAGGAPDVDSARRGLARILSNPPFRAWDPLTLVPDWLLPLALVIADLLGWFSRIVRWPFDRVLDVVSLLLRGPVGSIGIPLLAFGILCGIVLLYRTGLRAAIVAQAEVSAPSHQLPPTALRALELAQQHASVGRYRNACHFVFLATLLWIEEHADAHFDPTATNREHLAQVGNQPTIARALAPVVTHFDQLWYGQETVGESDYRALLGLAARVREATP